jgi:hypothetical protein
VDAIAPALIGLGLWFCYEAWTTSDPHPIAKIKSRLTGSAPGGGSGSFPTANVGVGNPAAVPGYNAAGNPNNVAGVPQ